MPVAWTGRAIIAWMSPEIRVAVTLTQDWHRTPGFTAVAANALAAALADRPDVEVIGVGPGGGPPTRGIAPSVPIARLRLGLPWLYDAWGLTGRPSVSAAVPEVDLVHLTALVPPPRERVPVVATIHDVVSLTTSEQSGRRGARLVARTLARMARRADAVLVPSEVGRVEFVRAGFDPERLAVVPPGVESPEPCTEEHVVLTLDRLGVEPPYVLFVGAAGPRSGLDLLATAMAMLDREELTTVLVGPPGLRFAEPVTSSRVVATGPLPGRDVAALRAGAAVSVMPSRADAFGLPVLEAMAAGTPVVTTTGTAMAEFADGVALIVPAGDPARLASAIAEVVDDPGRAGRMSTAGIERALGYSWQAAAEEVEAVYREVLR